MSLWSRITSRPRTLKPLQFAAWRSPWPRAGSRAVQCLAVLATVTAALLTTGGTTRAEVDDFIYNYENLQFGNIDKQDGWTDICGNANSRVVAGPGVNTSKTVSAPQLGCSQVHRLLPEPFYYTAADASVDWVFQGVAGASCCNVTSTVGILGPNHLSFGLDSLGNDLFAYARNSTGGVFVYGDNLSFSHWYELRLTVDFSVLGGLATLAHRDLTLGEQTFTIDENVRNINLAASPDAQGGYLFTTVFTRHDSFEGVCHVDNLHFDAPRPPCPVHTGDMNADTAANGADVQRFTSALVAGSSAFADICPGDFNNSGIVDLPDMGGFVSAMLN